MSEILDKKSMQKFYGDFYELGKFKKFSLSLVPADLHRLAPYAAFWGETDDGYRIDLVKAAPDHVRQNLKEVVEGLRTELLHWLGGPAASDPVISVSEAYLSYSALLRAAEWACADFVDR